MGAARRAYGARFGADISVARIASAARLPAPLNERDIRTLPKLTLVKSKVPSEFHCAPLRRWFFVVSKNSVPRSTSNTRYEAVSERVATAGHHASTEYVPGLVTRK